MVAIYTGADLKADGVGTLITDVEMAELSGKAMFRPRREFMAIDRVRFVGEPVAFVIAETAGAGEGRGRTRHGRLRRTLPAVGSTAEAASPDSPPIWKNTAAMSVCIGRTVPKPRSTRTWPRAKYRAVVDIVNNRLVPNPMEPRCRRRANGMRPRASSRSIADAKAVAAFRSGIAQDVAQSRAEARCG